MAAEPTSVTSFSWRSAAMTTQGNVRNHNEDAILDMAAAGLWVVADGMGGHKAGDVASRMIVESLCGVVKRARPSELVDDVEDRLLEVNSKLYQSSLEGDGGMSGSTVAALVAFDQYCISLWAGDSRVYRLRDGNFAQVTRDHSEVQAMLDEGVADAATASSLGALNVITRAVGGAAELYLDLELRELRDKDRYLLCSDGLYKELGEADIARHLATGDPDAASKALIKAALATACSDNVSVVVVQFSRA
jgi:serine/threonine protein phosphatase PrpC